MMQILRASLRSTWARNSAYAGRLVHDLDPRHYTAQPAPGQTINHPAWILCHLNVYAPIVLALLRAEPFEDPLGKPYARGSRVTDNPRDYPEPSHITAEFERLHRDGLAALDACGDDVFMATTPVERLRAMCPTVGELLVTFMIKHESFHLGQLSAWRRAMGFPPVDM